MTVVDDRFIYDGLTRGQAIIFLVKCGYDEKKLRMQSDDVIAVWYDIARRKENKINEYPNEDSWED